MGQMILQFLTTNPGPAAIVILSLAVVGWLLLKIKKAVSTMWPFIRKLVVVVEDLFGAEARPGVPARPGLMVRMETSEAADREIKATLAEHSEALKELQPNHGGSMKDVMNATRAELAEVKQALADHIASVRVPEQNVTVTVAAPVEAAAESTTN